MKQTIFLLPIFCLILLSCKKQNSVSAIPATLRGSWRMVAVKDNNSGSAITKPASVQSDVDITFSETSNNSGTFYGHTPTNNISQSDYLTGANQLLTISFLAMTKVEETSWGNEFVANVREAQHYSFESNGNLNIKTINKILTFQRQ